jgi:hypothetical protein
MESAADNELTMRRYTYRSHKWNNGVADAFTPAMWAGRA